MALIIKFHNKSWAAIGCQMTSMWPSARAENNLEVIWQPTAAQDLLWNLIIKALLVMILCCLLHSCTEHQTCNTRLICSYTLRKGESGNNGTIIGVQICTPWFKIAHLSVYI